MHQQVRRRILVFTMMGCALAGVGGGGLWWWNAPDPLQKLVLSGAGDADIDLARYRVLVNGRKLRGVDQELSGLAYDDDQDHLLALVARPAQVLRLSKAGDVLARYSLKGFGDLEAIAYLGDRRVAVMSERRSELSLIRLPEKPGEIDRLSGPMWTLAEGGRGNHGFEGMAYDVQHDRLLLVKEGPPRRFYAIPGQILRGEGPMVLEDLSHWLDALPFLRDLSSVEYDSRTGHYLLLSQESGILVELNAAGNMVSGRTLDRRLPGLRGAITHAEGMAMDRDGGIYLVSEPNLFYALGRH